MELIFAPARIGVRLLALNEQLAAGDISVHLNALPTYVEALKVTPSAVAFYFGDQAGGYFLVRRILNTEDRAIFSAPEGTSYVVQSIDRRSNPVQSLFRYYNQQLLEIGKEENHQDINFDARKRPWFELAMSQHGVVQTEPYTFFTTHKIGISIATRSERTQNVFGADLRLDTLSELLQRQKMTKGSRLMLTDKNGRLLASDQTDDPEGEGGILARLTTLQSNSPHNVSLARMLHAGDTWRVERMHLPSPDGRDTYLSCAVPETEMLIDARSVRYHLIFLIVSLLVLSLPVTYWLSHRIAQPLSILAQETEAICHFEFSSQIEVESYILEVDELASALRHTKSTLVRFIDIIARLTNESDFNKLMPALLRATTETAGVAGGLLYMMSDDSFRAVAGLWEGKILDITSKHNVNDAFSCRAALAQGCAQSFDVNDDERSRFALPAVQAVSVPLFNRDRRPIGVLVLLGLQAMDSSQLRFVEALSGFAAVALETRELIATQKALFESFIHLIASSIDAKSPYTGGHCARVPEVVHRLAKAACAQTEGPYAHFAMDDNAWETLHIASWLHDCGKVTTPEYVVDKATKLETLYDRIHEIRMRFEVLKRDAEIDYLQALLAGKATENESAMLEATLRQLDDDFAFVAECNQGSAFMGPEKIERLRNISARTWRRTLDDRLGVSLEESKRRGESEEVDLPVEEPLLSDRPEHCFIRSACEKYGPGNEWGFSMKIPELLYNRGELNNLSIARGTLNDEERFKINEHIIQTIIMLTSLPFPRHLTQVPEIAGSHHERMDGKGYPRGLTADQQSPLARMMVIADVFEAFTAGDRPYKTAKKLSESLNIMKRMAEEGHIDPELFSIFLCSNACNDYAEHFLDKKQRDVVDYSAYLPRAMA